MEGGNAAQSKNIALAACVCKFHNSNNVAVRCMNVNDHAVTISICFVIGKCTGIAADLVIEEVSVGCITGGQLDSPIASSPFGYFFLRDITHLL